MEDILGKEWHPFVTFIDLIGKLPEYIDQTLKREAEGVLYISSVANYELNQVYDLS